MDQNCGIQFYADPQIGHQIDLMREFSLEQDQKEEDSRQKRISRQKLYRDRKLAKQQEILKLCDKNASLLQEHRTQNEQLKAENRALDMLKEYKDSIFQTMRLAVDKIKSTGASFSSNFTQIQEYIWLKFHQPPDCLIKSTIAFITADLAVLAARSFRSQLKLHRNQILEAETEEERCQLEKRLEVLMAFRLRVFEAIREVKPMLIQEILINQMKQEGPDAPSVHLESIPPLSVEKHHNTDLLSIQGSNDDGKEEICLTFQSSVSSKEQKLYISRQQFEHIQLFCSSYNTRIKDGQLVDLHNIPMLVSQAGMPLLAGGRDSNSLSCDAKAQLCIARSIEAMESNKRELSIAILDFVIGVCKVLTPLQMCDFILAINWYDNCRLLRWLDLVEKVTVTVTGNNVEPFQE